MKPITKQVMKFIITAFAATMLVPATVMAKGYLVDSSGNVVRSGTGLCWHTGSWTPALADERCDPTTKPVAAIVPASKPKPAEVAVVVPAPKPAEVAVVPPVLVMPPAPLPQKIGFSGDALFAFDKSELRPEGKATLDSFVQQIDGATYDIIFVTGHTDRFGSNKYNQQLSERRAQAVKDYLVSKNVQASRIDTKGMGKTKPVTKAGECRGKRSAKVIACLQPDRRVDIEMTGTKIIPGSR